MYLCMHICKRINVHQVSLDSCLYHFQQFWFYEAKLLKKCRTKLTLENYHGIGTKSHIFSKPF